MEEGGKGAEVMAGSKNGRSLKVNVLEDIPKRFGERKKDLNYVFRKSINMGRSRRTTHDTAIELVFL